MGRVIAALVLALTLIGLLAPPVAAADVEFGTPSSTSSFGQGVTFTQPVDLARPAERIELLVTTAGAIGPLVVEVPAPAGVGERELSSSFDPGTDGHILPNTPLTARWRVFVEGASEGILGPEVSVVYEDDRFEWQTVEGDIVRVHWYEGDADFGARALAIGESAVEETSATLGVEEDEPVDFFIYADNEAFRSALGPGTRENVGGQANAELRTLFALISPGQIDDPWVRAVIPHELIHLVFDTAVRNPYHFPPRWLNEGLATYLSEGYGLDYRSGVEAAARDGDLIALEGLGGQFPTTADRFFLAYAESVSAVEFLVRTHGEEALVTLVRSYAEGRTDDEAFSAAIGQDVATFSAAWLADLGADEPTRYGPQPAPAGPVPDAWADDGDPGATSAPGAGTDPPSSGAPGQSASPAAPIPNDGDGGPPWLAVAIVGLLIGAVAVAMALRRRSRPAEAEEAGT